MENTIMHLGTLVTVLAFLAVVIIVVAIYADHRAHERFEGVELDKEFATTWEDIDNLIDEKIAGASGSEAPED